MNRFFSIVLLVAIFINLQVFALTPKENFYVNDYVGILNDTQTDYLIERANQLREENGVQVVVVIVPNVIGSSIDSYATEVFNDFGIGSSKDDNGVLLFLAVEDGEVTIVPGDGFRGYLSASKGGDILDSIFIPKAEKGNISEGIYDTFLELVKIGSNMTTEGFSENNNISSTSSENNSSPIKSKNSSSGGSVSYLFIIIVIILLVIIISKSTSSPRQYRRSSSYPRRRGTTFININTPKRSSSRPSSSKPSSSRPPTIGGGGRSSGGGTSRSFSPIKSSSSRTSSSRSSSRGGGGRSSGGGTSRKF